MYEHKRAAVISEGTHPAGEGACRNYSNFCPFFFFCPLFEARGIGGLAPRRYSLRVRAVHSRVPSRYYVARPVRVQCGSSMSVTPDGIRHVVPCFVVYLPVAPCWSNSRRYSAEPCVFFFFSLRISFFCCTFVP